MTTISDPVEWLKAQVEMYLADNPYLGLHRGTTVEDTLQSFIEYVEEKFNTPKGLFDR